MMMALMVKFSRDPKSQIHSLPDVAGGGRSAAQSPDRRRRRRGPSVRGTRRESRSVPHPAGAGHPGFTLVEILVVVAIIALLVGMLLPAYGKARKQARAVMCLSNQRQIATAMHAYTHDYQDRFPIAHYFDKARGLMVEWDTTTRWGEAARAGLIWQYAAGGAVQQCPAFDGLSMTPGDSYTGYNYNTTYIGRGQGEEPYREMDESPALATQLRAPSRTALAGDAGYDSGSNKFMRAPFDPNESLAHAGVQSYRHLNRTNAVFTDGHGEHTARRFRKPGARPYNERRMNWPTNGFLSQTDNSYSRQ